MAQNWGKQHRILGEVTTGIIYLELLLLPAKFWGKWMTKPFSYAIRPLDTAHRGVSTFGITRLKKRSRMGKEWSLVSDLRLLEAKERT